MEFSLGVHILWLQKKKRNAKFNEDIELPKLVLIGGNPKGFDEPFDRETLSGKRLRGILEKLRVRYQLIDMTENINDVPTEQEIQHLKKRFSDCKVVFLGRFVERALKKHLPHGVYMPHPASRRKSDLAKLEAGLKALIEKGRGKKCQNGIVISEVTSEYGV